MPPPSIEKTKERIERLRRGVLSPRGAPENLDKPLDPDFRMRGIRLELMVGDVAVSGTDIVDLEQQVGSQTLRMGGIAYVKTLDEHCFKGYSRRVMDNALRYMRREGFDVSMLYGIPQFYPKFGYATAFPDIRFTIALRDAERVEPKGYRFVDFAPKRLGALLRMYHKNIQGMIGPTRRDPKKWIPWRKGLTWSSKARCRVALGKSDRAVGYYVQHVENLTARFTEVGYSTPEVFPDILRAMARTALEQRLEKIELFLPEDDPFMAWCQMLGVSKLVRYRQDGEAMIRMIRIAPALRKVAPDLAQRVAGKGSLVLRTNLDLVRLDWRGGKMTVSELQKGQALSAPIARLPQWALAQLLYGYTDPRTLHRQKVLKATAPTLSTLALLFPPTPQFHYAADHF